MLKKKPKKPKILLHICCVGCGVYITEELSQKFQVVLYFFNPNIYPQREFDKRLEEAKRVAKEFKLKLIFEPYGHKAWLDLVKGYESEPERGQRCEICYLNRLDRTAQKAKTKKIKFFATTLTMSPHKDARLISRIGLRIAGNYGLTFFDKDFKKQDGFRLSSQLSKELGLYRQNYCGCEFSLKT